MKKMFVIASTLLMLAGCGNSLGLDEEKMKEAVIKEAMSWSKIKEGGYEASDIEIKSICKAKRQSEKDVAQHYFVHWETSDGEVYDKKTVMKKYEQDGAADFYKKTDKCIKY